MSVLEIVLYVVIGAATLYLIGSTIYEFKHPEAKEKRKAKKEAKKQAKENKNNADSQY